MNAQYYIEISLGTPPQSVSSILVDAEEVLIPVRYLVQGYTRHWVRFYLSFLSLLSFTHPLHQFE